VPTRTLKVSDQEMENLEELYAQLLNGSFYQDYDLSMELMGALGRLVRSLREAKRDADD
jgi:hypothetical protein